MERQAIALFLRGWQLELAERLTRTLCLHPKFDR